jgi:hypothetical protein
MWNASKFQCKYEVHKIAFALVQQLQLFSFNLTSNPSRSLKSAFDRHRAASLGVLSIILALAFAVVPLSLQCLQCCLRRRRRRRLSSLSGSMSSIASMCSQSVDNLSRNGEGEKAPCDGVNAAGADERTPVLDRNNNNYGSTS